jgi:hypothetical protein
MLSFISSFLHGITFPVALLTTVATLVMPLAE